MSPGARSIGDELAGLLGAATGADGQDFALLGLLLGGVGNDEAADGRLLGLGRPDDDPVFQRLQVHRCSSSKACSARRDGGALGGERMTGGVSTRPCRVLTVASRARPGKPRFPPASQFTGRGQADAQARVGAGVERGRAVGPRGATRPPRRPSPRCRCTARCRGARPAARRVRPSSTRRARSAEFAATPPPITTVAIPVCSATRRSLVDEHVDHRGLERGGDVGDVEVGVLAHVLHDRGLEPREREVDAVVEHRARERDRRRIAAAPRARSIAGPPG